MIVNLLAHTPEVVSEFNNSNFDFYLTGSRYWNTATSHSDWDFFVQDSAEVRCFLLDLNFKYRISHGYNDSETIDVMELSNKVYSKVVHVQLVKDVFKTLFIQQHLYQCYPDGLPNNKTKRTKLWNDAFKFYERLKLVLNCNDDPLTKHN